MQLHTAFPELDINIVNDFLAECQGDAKQAQLNIEAILGPSTLRGHGTACHLPICSTTSRACSSPTSPTKTSNASRPAAVMETPAPNLAATIPAALLPRERASPPTTMAHLFPVPIAAPQPVQRASTPRKKTGLRKILSEVVQKQEELALAKRAAERDPPPGPGERPEDYRQQVPDLANGHPKPQETQPAAAPATAPSQAPVDWERLLPRPVQPSRLVGLPVPLPAERPSSGSKFDGNPKHPKHARSDIPPGILELLNLPDEAKAALRQPADDAEAAAAAPKEQPAPHPLDAQASAAAPDVATDPAVAHTLWDAGTPEEAPSEHAAKLEFLQVPFHAHLS